jgi:hypothetical protein
MNSEWAFKLKIIKTKSIWRGFFFSFQFYYVENLVKIIHEITKVVQIMQEKQKKKSQFSWKKQKNSSPQKNKN